MCPEPYLDVVAVHRGETADVLLAGELDFGNVPLLRARISHILADPRIRRIGVDTALLEFCDISGLRSLVQAHDQAARSGVSLRLVRTSPQVRRILHVTGMWQVLLTPA
jgi:anti-sigma B factor antagonist